MSGRLGWDQAERTVAVRRTDQGFGIDVNERNIIVRISPGSAAEEDGQLKVGERIVAIDTVAPPSPTLPLRPLLPPRRP